MNEQNKSISDAAADKIQAELVLFETVCKGTDTKSRIRKSLITPVASMLKRFCYQSEEFAAAVLECKKTLKDNIDGISNIITAQNPALSDVEAYAKAVEFYIPHARVTVSFRITIPCEIDDDLMELEVPEDSTIILDLLGTEGE